MLLDLPKKLMRKFQQLSMIQQAVVLLAIGVGGWWLWTNYLARRFEGFAEGGDETIGTLTCTMYYTEWCPACKAAKPEWEKFMQRFHGKKKNGRQILVTKIDCEKFPAKAKEQNVTGYPTFKFDLDGKTVKYDGERTLAAFAKYLDNVLHSDFQ